MADPDFIAVYGSLRRGMQAESKMSRLKFLGQGYMDASLYALGWYPGVKLGTGHRTVVDIFELPKDEQLRRAIIWDLDGYEGYSPTQPQNSLFVRKVVNVWDRTGTDIPCFVYEYNYPVNRAPLVENGDWNEFRSEAPQGA